MKIILFLADGLDYFFIPRNNLRTLPQEVNGTFYIDSEYYHQGQPLSPRIWGPVITGVKPSIRKNIHQYFMS